MNDKCNACKSELISWSKFKDLKQKEGTGLAICGSIINGLDHFWSGEARSNKHKSDYRTLELLYCQNCNRYYLKCPKCGSLILCDEMPTETRTMVTCSSCNKRVLYAQSDYSSGG